MGGLTPRVTCRGGLTPRVLRGLTPRVTCRGGGLTPRVVRGLSSRIASVTRLDLITSGRGLLSDPPSLVPQIHLVKMSLRQIRGPRHKRRLSGDPLRHTPDLSEDPLKHPHAPSPPPPPPPCGRAREIRPDVP